MHRCGVMEFANSNNFKYLNIFTRNNITRIIITIMIIMTTMINVFIHLANLLE